MKIAVAADHAGFELKKLLLPYLERLDFEVEDLGAHEFDALDDYPDYAALVGRAIHEGRAERAVIFCGSGVGVCVAVNKFPGVRAGICHDTYSAHQGVEHDNMNVLCIGSRIVGASLAEDIVKAFVEAEYSNEERHRRRLKKIGEIERQFLRTEEVK